MADRKMRPVSMDVTITLGPIEQHLLIELDPDGSVEKMQDEREVER